MTTLKSLGKGWLYSCIISFGIVSFWLVGGLFINLIPTLYTYTWVYDLLLLVLFLGALMFWGNWIVFNMVKAVEVI